MTCRRQFVIIRVGVRKTPAPGEAMKRATILLITALPAFACSGTAVDVVPGGADAGKETVNDEVAEVIIFSDAPGATDAGLDIPLDLGIELPVLPCDPGEGCFTDGCTENSDCQSGWCVEHMGEKVCSQTCQEECPEGWTCTQVAGTAPDLVFVCVSNFPNLCRPCAEADDCAGATGTEDACVQYGEGENFCGGACAAGTGASKECPWGFSCKKVETVDGVEVEQCMADAGECPCTDTSVELGLWTPCELSNEHGACTGKRACEEEGLSECNAPVPAAEMCNGLDDDCDGEVDEPTLEGGDYVNLCDDGNDCTDDECAGEEGCINQILAAGDCTDENPCTVADHCVEGSCIGDPVECDDDNPCTDNVCTETGGCEYPPVSGDCVDGNPCTAGDHCVDGLCKGEEVACDCQSDEECAQLEDGNLCDGTLICNTDQIPFLCVVKPDSEIECPEPGGQNAFCLQPHCQPASGECSLVPDHEGLLCDDADACTVGSQCVEGVCSGGEPVNCNDGNVCTDDSCDSTQGCLHENNAAPCTDGDVCTTADQCAEGECAGGPLLVCDDGDVCNGVETCDPGLGCVVGEKLACDDGDACNGQESCHPVEGCVVGEQLVCDDGNDCTGDICVPEGGCVYPNLAGIECDDGDACTQLDLCHDGECVGSGKPDCEDGNVCTDNSCDPLLGCILYTNTVPCDDGDLCTVGDHCHLAGCISAGVMVCDDGNICTDDSCDAEAGCVFYTNTHPCDDGNTCTIEDACAGGWCVAGVPVACDDANPCTDDSCDPAMGCSNDDLPDETPCSFLNPQHVCISGQCACQSDCDGKECGPDGCGGTCGQCLPAQHECMDGLCACVPACEGKECGDDGCGQSCGECGGPLELCVEGECICQPHDCAALGKACGDWGDGCGGTVPCGVCGCGETCDQGACVFHGCEGKDCGSDGCGGECGVCTPGLDCVDGVCQAASGKRVFVTSTKYTAGLGGVGGADAKCQNHADGAGLGGTWMCWISHPGGPTPSSRFNHFNGPYRLLDGTLVANNWADLTDGTLNNNIGRDEFNLPVDAGYVWTATKPNGTVNTDSWGGCGNTICNGWTNGGTCLPCSSCGGFGGDSGHSSGSWTDTVCGCCDNTWRIYCFEQ